MHEFTVVAAQKREKRRARRRSFGRFSIVTSISDYITQVDVNRRGNLSLVLVERQFVRRTAISPDFTHDINTGRFIYVRAKAQRVVVIESTAVEKEERPCASLSPLRPYPRAR